MWKIAIAFVVFAALALWVLGQGGDIDMSGEKHGVETSSHADPAASATAPASPASADAAASAASR
jgi:hypothetical protein